MQVNSYNVRMKNDKQKNILYSIALIAVMLTWWWLFAIAVSDSTPTYIKIPIILYLVGSTTMWYIDNVKDS